ncbi:MAG: hypothetical protein AB7W47_17215 [Calditrichaceae bacterium]
MDFKQSYAQFIQTGTFDSIYESLRVIASYLIKSKYVMIIRHPKFSHYRHQNQNNPVTREELTNELGSFIFELMERENLFSNADLQIEIEDVESYVYVMVYNEFKISKWSEFKTRFSQLFDKYSEKYHYWQGLIKERCIDPMVKADSRNYYMSSWNEIPELYQDRLLGVVGVLPRSKWHYLTSEYLLDWIDEAFETVIASLRINHFLKLLDDSGFFHQGEDRLIFAERVDRDHEHLEYPVDEENSGFDVFYEEVISATKPKYKRSLVYYAHAYISIPKDEHLKTDVYKIAESLAGKDLKASTIRNHVEYNADAVFKMVGQAWQEHIETSDPGYIMRLFFKKITEDYPLASLSETGIES